MTSALIAPHAVAALVLAVAGLAKLRTPGAASAAVGLPPVVIRTFAVTELILAAGALWEGALWSSVLMAGLYAGFAVLTLRLARAGSSCGCFGASAEPASPVQSLLSASLAVLSVLSAAAGPVGGAGLLDRSAPVAAVLILGTLAAVYAVVLAYSELPVLWRSWSPA